MIQASTALSFAATATALVVTPGAGFVLFSSTMLTRGRRAALALWGGIAAGTIVFAAIVVAVYPLIIGGIGGFRRVIQIAGGLYLVYLGGRGVYRARHIHTGQIHAPARVLATTNELAIAGITSALTNPGLFVMYVLLLPTFVPRGTVDVHAATLAAEHIGIKNAWYTVLLWRWTGARESHGLVLVRRRSPSCRLWCRSGSACAPWSGHPEATQGCATPRPSLRLPWGYGAHGV